MNQILRCVIALTALIIPLIGFAKDFVFQNMNFTVIDEDAKTCKTGDNRHLKGDVVIPSMVSDGEGLYTVTEIGDYITGVNITIPNTVKTIKEGAFVGIDLKNINIDSGNPVFASSDGILYSKDMTKLISCPEGKIYDVFYVPDSVKEIGNYAFKRCGEIHDIVLPNSLLDIGDYAFSDCWRLRVIELPASVRHIGICAFFNSMIYNIIVDSGNPYLTSSMDNHLVLSKDMKRLICSVQWIGGKITIPETVNTIGECAFYGCEWEEILLPNSIISIEYDAFSSCQRLTSINIPNSVTSLDWAFRGCKSLTSMSIPNSVTSLNGTFQRCTSLTSVSIPNSVTSLDHTFGGCTGLTSVSIPNSVTSLEGTFPGCTSLTSVSIPNSVTSLDNTFRRCTSLTNITIPSSVSEIKSTAFASCDNLIDIYSFNPVPPSLNFGAFDDLTYSNATLHVLKSSLEAYKKADCWEKFFKITSDMAGIEDIDSDETSLCVENGKIVNTTHNMLEVFNPKGEAVYQGNDDYITIPSSGLYIVIINRQKTQKLYVNI